MKSGRKPSKTKKRRTTVTLDAPLVSAIEAKTENLSGFLNTAGWKEIKRKPPSPQGPGEQERKQ